MDGDATAEVEGRVRRRSSRAWLLSERRSKGSHRRGPIRGRVRCSIITDHSWGVLKGRRMPDEMRFNRVKGRKSPVDANSTGIGIRT